MNNDNYCSKCGAEITGENIFCSKCGYQVGNSEEEAQFSTQAKPNNNFKFRFLTILTVVFMPYIGFFLIIFKRPFSKKANVLCSLYCVAICTILFANIFIQQNKNIMSSKDTQTNQSTSIESTQPSPQADSKKQLPPYSIAVEQAIEKWYGTKVKFDIWTNFRQWELGGLIYVENQFTIDKKKHTYLARCGGDKIFYLKIDGKTIFWDEDGETKFIDKK